METDLINGEYLGTFPLTTTSPESFVQSALFLLLVSSLPSPLPIAHLPPQPSFSPIPLTDCLCTIKHHSLLEGCWGGTRGTDKSAFDLFLPLTLHPYLHPSLLSAQPPFFLSFLVSSQLFSLSFTSSSHLHN